MDADVVAIVSLFSLLAVIGGYYVGRASALSSALNDAREDLFKARNELAGLHDWQLALLDDMLEDEPEQESPVP